MKTNEEINAIRQKLFQFSGTENWYRHFTKYLYTDGIKYLADSCGCHWMLDKVFTLQRLPQIKAEEFQLWTLKVFKDHTAILTCDDGNHNIVYTEQIDVTDFPLPEGISFYFENQTACLKQER